jgi:hypothetical protein
MRYDNLLRPSSISAFSIIVCTEPHRQFPIQLQVALQALFRK